jgi:hypothetical protein
VYIHATLTSIDTKGRNYYGETSNSKQVLIDIENNSNIFAYTKSGGLAKASFSTGVVGSHVIANGYYDKKDPTKLVVTNIIIFSELPAYPSIPVNLTPTTPITSSPTPSSK